MRPARVRPDAADTPGPGPEEEPAFVERVPGGLVLRVKVVPGSSRSALAGVLDGRLKVRIAVPAERGRANRALVSLIREWLGVTDVAIVSGVSSAEKRVRVGGIDRLDRRRLAAISSRDAKAQGHPEARRGVR